MGILGTFRGWFCAVAAGLLLAGAARAQPLREYEAKAAFLYNFVSFVEWPENAFADAKAPFVIGILGNDPFGRVLDDVVANERAKNRPLMVKRLSRVDEAEDCQIVFVSASEARYTAEILRRCGDRPVLLVGDSPGFAEAGGSVGFRMEGARLKLDMNVDAARARNLNVSSKLLRVAHVIGKETVE
jgi:hypothetical protein